MLSLYVSFSKFICKGRTFDSILVVRNNLISCIVLCILVVFAFEILPEDAKEIIPDEAIRRIWTYGE